MDYNQIYNWINDNSFYIFVAVLIIFFVGRHYYMKRKDKLKVSIPIPPDSLNTLKKPDALDKLKPIEEINEPELDLNLQLHNFKTELVELEEKFELNKNSIDKIAKEQSKIQERYTKVNKIVALLEQIEK